MLYTLPQIMKVTRDDLGLYDIPNILSDEEFIERMKTSTLPLFTSYAPRKKKFIMTSNMMIGKQYDCHTFRIPKDVIKDCGVMDVGYVTIKPTNASGDFYISQPMVSDPYDIATTVANMRLQADMAALITHAFTWEFQAPDIIKIYNGYYGAPYEVTLNVTHDYNLSTIPDTYMMSFKELLLYDMQEYLYNKFRRKNRISTGVGEIELDLDDWRDGKSNKKDLLERWRASSITNYANIVFF